MEGWMKNPLCGLIGGSRKRKENLEEISRNTKEDKEKEKVEDKKKWGNQRDNNEKFKFNVYED